MIAVGLRRWARTLPLWLGAAAGCAAAGAGSARLADVLREHAARGVAAAALAGIALLAAGPLVALATRRLGALGLSALAVPLLLLALGGWLTDPSLSLAAAALAIEATDLALLQTLWGATLLAAAATGAGVPLRAALSLERLGVRALYEMLVWFGYQFLLPGLTLVAACTYLDAALVTEPTSLRGLGGAARALARRPEGLAVLAFGGALQLAAFVGIAALWSGGDPLPLVMDSDRPDAFAAASWGGSALASSLIAAVLGALYACPRHAAPAADGPPRAPDLTNPFAS